MKRLNKTMLAVAAAFAVTALLPAGYAFSAEKMSAVVVFVSGDVKLKRAADKDYAELKLNEALQPGDSIMTAAGAKASLVTKTGAEIRINENSTFSIPGKSKVREMFDLSVGQVWGRMLHKMAKLNVRTPTAVCAVRGTEADIEQKDTLTVKVYEGHVDLTNALGKQSLKAGQISTVAGGAAPTAPRQMSGSEMGKWQESIDVKDIGKYLTQVGLSDKGVKKLDVKIESETGAKDVEIKLKKK
ncbi:MAG: FecR family protein [Elusimicrobiota bacterium]|nr:FecR family protein [Elusimicrobiota bacterium]